MRRSFTVLHGYAAITTALVGNMVRDAYLGAHDMRELYPQFEFLPTFYDEIMVHHTRLPVVNVPVSTVAVVGALLAGSLATHFRLIELLWLFLIDFFSGRWLYNLAFVHIPAWLPFLAAEPGVPDLLSDPEDSELSVQEGDAVNVTASSAAMEKLQEVKRLHADRVIERPDDWLVFDPEEEDLVPKKQLDARRLRRKEGLRSSTSSTSTSTSSPGASPTRKHPNQLDDDEEEEATAFSFSHDDQSVKNGLETEPAQRTTRPRNRRNRNPAQN